MTIGKKDKLIPLSVVPQLILDLTGVSRGRATVYSWTRKGKRGGCRTMDARIVRLETVRRLDQIFTSEQAVKEFINAVG
jgi:hypothetical protein